MKTKTDSWPGIGAIVQRTFLAGACVFAALFLADTLERFILGGAEILSTKSGLLQVIAFMLGSAAGYIVGWRDRNRSD